MQNTSGTGAVPHLDQTSRIWVLGINMALAWVIYVAATGLLLPAGGGSVWLLAALSYWLLALIAAPFFTPPRDALATAIAAILLLAPLDVPSSANLHAGLTLFGWAAIVYSTLIAVLAITAIFYQGDGTQSLKRIGSYRLSGMLGRGEILLTPAVIISVAGFYQGELGWMLTILCLWVFMLIAKPVELLVRLWLMWSSAQSVPEELKSVGTIVRIDGPNVVRVALAQDNRSWTIETAHVVNLPTGKTTYVLPLYAQIQNDMVIGIGLCCEVDGVPASAPSNEMGFVYSISDEALAAKLKTTLSGDAEKKELVGIVSEGSFIETIKFQVIDSFPLEEGMVVFAQIRGKKIYYQILDASTNEESFQQNQHGLQIASAAQLGSHDSEEGFQKFPWLPDMNQPLFLAAHERVPEQKLQENEFIIGQVPNTPFGIPVILDDLIEYHTAVLGITGTGKTELVFTIIQNALERGAKVFCVDFTGEYKARLSKHKPKLIGLTVDQGSELEKLIFAVESGEYGAKAEKGALQKFVDSIKPQVTEQIKEFLTSSEQKLGIFELAEITNTKATLRTTELYLSAIMDWARKNRKAERILIVLEEAHTIVPEVYNSGFDSETQWVVGRIGQIALQGRKYGVGLLLVSQRTALVNKTVLSQCNTYFTHALVDKTSLDYLSGVYSAAHVSVIPNLRTREFLAHGKAVKSERPLLAVRAFDPEIAAASKALDSKREKTKP